MASLGEERARPTSAASLISSFGDRRVVEPEGCSGMGTFGTGAFSSDGALDLLEQLAERPTESRTAALEHMFAFVRDNPDLLWREFFPDEIVAAAAIIAASLPGGEPFSERLKELADNDLAPDIRLPAPAPRLARPALEALLWAAGPNGPWHQGWTTETTAAEAQHTSDTLLRVLRDADGQP